jgi:hypothetical protein
MALPIEELRPLMEFVEQTKSLLAALYELKIALAADPAKFFLRPEQQFATEEEREEWERDNCDLSATRWGDGKLEKLIEEWFEILREAQKAPNYGLETRAVLRAIEMSSMVYMTTRRGPLMLVHARRAGAVSLRLLESHLARLEVCLGALLEQ